MVRALGEFVGSLVKLAVVVAVFLLFLAAWTGDWFGVTTWATQWFKNLLLAPLQN